MLLLVWLVVMLITPAAASANESVPAPDFSAVTTSGKSITLSNLRGKIVLLDFWATWCPPCRVEVPFLLDVFKTFKDRDFVMVSISLDRDLEAARRFVKEKGMDWVQVIDREAGDRLSSLYAVDYIPATFIIDRQGRIVAQNLRGAELKEMIAGMMK